MIGRLRPGSDGIAAQRQADVVAADLTRRVPGRERVMAGFTVSHASSMTESDRNMFMPAISMAFGSTVLLLIVTCANLAGVMQARLIARRRDLAIRRSLGAGRGRLIGEWLSESLVLALAGGAAGLVGSRVAAAALSAIKLPAVLIGDLSFETAKRFVDRVDHIGELCRRQCVVADIGGHHVGGHPQQIILGGFRRR